MAFAPRRPLLGVPSSAIMVASSRRWLAASMPVSSGAMNALDILDGLQHALAQVVRLVAVAQFHGFVLARGGAAGNCRAANRAAFENNVGFNGGVSARIQNLARMDCSNLRHVTP